MEAGLLNIFLAIKQLGTIWWRRKECRILFVSFMDPASRVLFGVGSPLFPERDRYRSI